MRKDLRYSIPVENPLRKSYELYLSETEETRDVIRSLDIFGTRQLLMDLYREAPHAVAKTLAIRHPWSADLADEAEAYVQQLLPLDGLPA